MTVERYESEPAPARDWERLFRQAGVAMDKLEAAKSARSKTTIIGHFLTPLVNRSVQIEVEGYKGVATLRAKEGRARTTLYYFEFEMGKPDTASGDEEQDAEDQVAEDQDAEDGGDGDPETQDSGGDEKPKRVKRRKKRPKQKQENRTRCPKRRHNTKKRSSGTENGS